MDQETGLYYFGARYYDPRTSVWQSPDPILASYLQGRPNGGVFNPANLGLYTYVHNKPVVAVDPDGKACAPCAVIWGVITWGGRVLFGYEVGREVGDVATGQKPASEAIEDLATDVVVDRATMGAGKFLRRIFGRANGSLSGPKTTTNADPNKDPSGYHGVVKENETAEVLSRNGFKVEQNPNVPGAKEPDYLIDGEVFDNYAPETSDAFSIADKVRSKVSSGQAPNIVLNLDDSNVNISDLRDQIRANRPDGLGKVFVVKGEEVYQLDLE